MTRFSILKVSFIFSLTLLVTSACKKVDEPTGKPNGPRPGQNERVQTEPGQSGLVSKISYSQHDIDSLLKLPVQMRPADARGAVEYWLAEPLRMPPGAHFLPTKNITPIEQTDSTALFSADVKQGPMSLLVTLAKKKNGTESIWVVTRIEQIMPRNATN